MSETTPSENVPITSTLRALPHIPLEILLKIGQQVDRASALNLSLTCRALRDAGECKIWETIDVTTGWDPEGADAGQLDIPTAELYQSRADTVDSKLRHVLAALESYPFRLECIRTLRIEPSDGGAENPRALSIFKLLTLVSKRLKRLDFVPLRFGGMWLVQSHPEFSHTKFITMLNDLDLSFPTLTHLKYAWEAEGCDTLDSWIMRMENLEEIEYCYSEEAYGEKPSAKIERRPLLHLKRVSLYFLQEVEAGEDDPTQSILTTLLSLAPNLEFLRIAGEWHPRRRDPLLKEIAKLEKLKTIVLTRGDDTNEVGYVSMDYEGGVDFQHLGKAEMRFEEAVVQNLGWDEMHELRFESLRLARAANLKRLTVLTTPRLPLADYMSLGVGPTPNKTGRLSLFFFQYILRNPLLSTILFLFVDDPFPSAYNANAVDPEYFVEPSRWEEEGHRGAVIRQYANHAMGKEEFWHIRAISRSLDHQSGMAYVGARRCWQDFTHYKGRTVPRHILEAVYAQAGLEVESVDAGRDLELGEAAWGILREWRETAGDESEVDDDFTDEDVEGSELDDEDDGIEDDVSDGDGWGAQVLADNMGDDADGWEDTDDDGEYDEDSDDPLGLF